MWQFLKSDLLWQLVGGFAIGTIGMVVFGPADTTHTLVHHMLGAVGLGG